MTKSQVICFEAVAECKSFSQAARQLRISQPAVSFQISKLEQEVGFLLIDRTGPELTLTRGGKLLLDFFAHSRVDFQRAMLDASEKESGHKVSTQLPMAAQSAFAG